MNTEVPSNVLVETQRLWYYIEDYKQKGPIPEHLIRNMFEEKVLGPETLIWSKPMTDWAPASQVEIFSEALCHCSPPSPYATTPVSEESVIRKAPDTVPQVRPWVRFWARFCDIYLFVFTFGVVCGIVCPSVLELPDAFVGISIMLMWVFVEAGFLSAWGTTPGKWLLKTKVKDLRGGNLSFSNALSRSFLVLFKGLGLGIPIVGLITLCVAHSNLKKQGWTSWDRENGSVVVHARISEIRTVVATLLILGFIILIAMTSFYSATAAASV